MNITKKSNILCWVVSLTLLLSGAYALEAKDRDAGAVSCSAAATERVEKYKDVKVYAGGFPFGIRFRTSEVTVVKTNSFLSDGISVSPAGDAGIQPEDIIKSVNGKSVENISEILEAINASPNQPLSVTLLRNQKEITIELLPKKCDDSGDFRLGVLLRDSSAGIGTVTYINTDNFAFAGLGHGICDSESGKVIPLSGGYISNVHINGINKGKSGEPGELRGSFESEKCGKLLSNTEVGLYGIYTDKPALTGKPITIAEQWEVEVGKATILCTLDDNRRTEYEIEIAEINHNDGAKTKNYVVKVTDPALLEKTGGIVQGMSGSPILQNGKLIGAVTHVMINDPTTGYGIYIGNMLDEMKNYL